MSNSVTLEIRGGTTPDRLLETTRAKALPERPENRLPLAPVSLLTPGEVAILFRVDPKTVTRWAKAGKLTSIRTPGGTRRYRETEVRALIGGTDTALDG